MTEVDLAAIAVFAALIATPHLLPLQRVAPASAAAVWFLALCLRALGAAALAAYMLLYLPQTDRFAGAADLCISFTVPLIGLHLHVPGLRLAQGAAIVPALLLVGSLAWAAFSLLRARIYAQRLVGKLAVGNGPLGSTVLESEEVVLAVTRLGPPRVLVSGTTLATLDPEELTAGLQHELGHLRRAHRPVLFAASVLKALARWQPGAAAAYRELCFSLERDADDYALGQTRNPLALAGAICKSALAQGGRAPVLGIGGRSRVSVRLDYLLAGGRRSTSVRLENATRLLAATMIGLTLFIAVAAPVWAIARPGTFPHFPSAAGWRC
ncbi:MAG: hypothetical protein ACXVRH_12295 [Thermoleophilaceae bacterium]